MNPTIPQEFIDREYERDPASAAAEYGAEFRSEIAAFVDLAVLEACTVDGLFELPPISGVTYVAFVDPSGGSSDSMTMAISHRDHDGLLVLDCVREVRAPFQPENVVMDFCQTLTSYGIGTVVGDRYAGEWPREQFSKRNTYRPSERVKSDIYRDCLPLLNSRKCQLLDIPRLISQFHGLERRTARGGKDSIDHGPGAHDDIANAVAGALVLASHHVRPLNFHVPVVASRAEIMADYVAGIFDPAGGSSILPGGYPHGTVTGIDAQLGWTPSRRN
jgi:hypothetical protein